jgi:RES domain-containing protein
MSDATYYRAMRPAWAFAPLSGAGAAVNGGRWNAKGVPALYLAADPMTTLAEYNQDIQFRPVTLAEYHIVSGNFADCTTPTGRASFALDDDIFTAAWRSQTLMGMIPASWSASDRLREDGFDGLLYPSRINGGTCLALWRWNEPDGCAVTVTDLDGRLPHDARSWPSK